MTRLPSVSFTCAQRFGEQHDSWPQFPWTFSTSIEILLLCSSQDYVVFLPICNFTESSPAAVFKLVLNFLNFFQQVKLIKRRSCAYSRLTEGDCMDRGCCWDPEWDGIPPCYHKSGTVIVPPTLRGRQEMETYKLLSLADPSVPGTPPPPSNFDIYQKQLSGKNPTRFQVWRAPPVKFWICNWLCIRVNNIRRTINTIFSRIFERFKIWSITSIHLEYKMFAQSKFENCLMYFSWRVGVDPSRWSG